MKGLLTVAIISMLAAPASAEFAKIDSVSEFEQLVTGKTLTRPLVRLEVAPGGAISGMGAAWEVTGSWSWQNGYFCRSLAWGGDDLGYNCQEVTANGRKIRFTSDQGTGDSADFTLR
ncbi:dihydrodipicolinate reductase [uncultured Sulfitobacter sp.]|uniref:dihydrodipicolinate reductase n=1 Tax=uncultured Sulfitobacter sp. TaxID=191468 RepID=UPI002625B54E|nr:dihydrodipicolinate reductase [uncultured Sulfitobacter sp.]